MNIQTCKAGRQRVSRVDGKAGRKYGDKIADYLQSNGQPFIGYVFDVRYPEMAINVVLHLFDEAITAVERFDCGDAMLRLGKVRVDGRFGHGVHSLQVTTRRHIVALS